jgi:hypothetical protein
MGRPRKMPTKASILDYWQNCQKMWDAPKSINICMACGFDGLISRCHVQSVADGGSDDLSNIVLLCRSCHHRQESVCVTEYGRASFMSSLMDGAPYMVVRATELMASAKMMGYVDESVQLTPSGIALLSHL